MKPNERDRKHRNKKKGKRKGLLYGEGEKCRHGAMKPNQRLRSQFSEAKVTFSLATKQNAWSHDLLFFYISFLIF